MIYSSHPLHEKQLAYFRHLKKELEARQTLVSSISLRRQFLKRQKIANYQNEHDRIANIMNTNLVSNTTKMQLQQRVRNLQQLGAMAVSGIED
jgi:hypothetical protein